MVGRGEYGVERGLGGGDGEGIARWGCSGDHFCLWGVGGVGKVVR